MGELHLHLTGSDLSSLVPELSYEGSRYTGDVVNLRLDADDFKDLRWLWEDPVVDLYKPGSGRRHRAEQAALRIGEMLGQAFAASEPMRRLLDQALQSSKDEVVLVSSELDDALILPWELARASGGRHFISAVGGLARLRMNVPVPMVPFRDRSGPLRVLLVVSRPNAEEDVEYQAIATKLLDRLAGKAEVTLVRPGTFNALRRALDQGGWDIVHYDGHGAAGKLFFEDGPVAAERLGSMLGGAGVPLFAMNACQSAAAETTIGIAERNVCSVAHALVRTGATGVVAMGASVRVSSAVAFFDRFYEELAVGTTLARAAHRARRAVEAGQRQGLLDWAIPVLYLRQDIAPLAQRAAAPSKVLQTLQGFLPDATISIGNEVGSIFIGRDGDLYRLDRAVDERPCVLIYGVSGIGKTTLVEYLLMWRRRTGGADRVLNFSFRHAPSMESLTQALQDEVAEAHPESIPMFNSPRWSITPLSDRLLRLGQVLTAEGSPMCLVLFDNLETLGGYPEVGSGPYTDQERALFRRLLSVMSGPRCRVLLTSRRDEVEFLGDSVARLRLTGVKDRYRLMLLQEYAKVFDAERRLRDALQDEQRKPVLNGLLRLLGGHPLATRVAAYGLKKRSVAEVLASIQGESEQIRVPTSDWGTRSEDWEQVLAGVLDHLPERRRRALGILGVFVGPFTETDLVLFVGHELPDSILVDRSELSLRRLLVEAHDLGLIAPSDEWEKVWAVLPGVRAALHRLWWDTLDEETQKDIEQRYVNHWLLCESVISGPEGIDDDEMTHASVNEENLRHALALAERNRQWTAVSALIGILTLLFRRYHREKDREYLRREWLNKTTHAMRDPAHSTDTKLLNLWCTLRWDEGDHLLDFGHYEQARGVFLETIERLDSRAPMRRKWLDVFSSSLGVAEIHLGNYDNADKWLKRSLEVLRRGKGRRDGEFGEVFHHLGRLSEARGNTTEAETWYKKSLKIRKRINDPRGLAATLHHLGRIAELRGELEKAEVWYHQSLLIEESVGNLPGIAESYHQLGTLALRRESFDAAEEWYRKSMGVKESLGYQLADTRQQLGEVEAGRGNLSAAKEWYLASRGEYEEIGDRPGIAACCQSLGMIEFRSRNFDAAGKWYQTSLAISRETGLVLEEARALYHLGLIDIFRGEYRHALAAHLAAFASCCDQESELRTFVLLAMNRVYCTIGETAFSEICDQLNTPPFVLDGLVSVFTCQEEVEGQEGQGLPADVDGNITFQVFYPPFTKRSGGGYHS
jgi:tetratricopeptide (TPR) repeat protein